jgi:hypothetical protein
MARALAGTTSTVSMSREERMIVQPVDTTFRLSVTDWQLLRDEAELIGEPVQWVRNLGWAAVTLVPASVIALLTWVPAYDQLPASSQLTFAPVAPALAALAILGLVLAGTCYKAHSAIQGSRTGDKDRLLRTMDMVEGKCGLTGEGASLGIDDGDEAASALLQLLRRQTGFCVDCGRKLEPRIGPGRPPIRCASCRAARG